MRVNVFLFLILSFILTSRSTCLHDSRPTDISNAPQRNTNIPPRQAPANPFPVSVTTSSFNWWPFPPWGTTVSTPTSTLGSTSPTSVSITSSSSQAISNAGSTTQTSESTSISTNNSMSTPVIHITAQQPANTTSPLPKMKPQDTHALHPAFVAPLGVALGALLAVLCVWFCYGLCCARRRPRRIKPCELQPGPPYVPEKCAQSDSDEADPENNMVSEPHPGFGSPSKYSQHGTSYRDASSHLWLTRALSTHVPPRTFAWPSIAPTPCAAEHEEDPFLAVPIAAPKTRRGTSTRSAAVLSLLGEYEDEYEEVDLAVPYDSLRQKSIRRGILDRVKFGSLRGGNAGKNWHDHRVPAGGAVQSERRGETDRKTADFDDYMSPAGGGFRILEEHLEDLVHSTSGTCPPGTEISNGEEESETQFHTRPEPCVPADIYTPLPVRHSPAKGGRQPQHRQIDSSVLPHSPPRITSPQLESQLFFHSPAAGVAPSVSSQQSRNMAAWKRRIDSVASASRPDSSQGRRVPRAGVDKALPSEPASAQTRLSSSRGQLGTPRGRHVARKDALHKVQQIVKSSWSQRDLSDAERVMSPTMFGARV